MLVELALWSEAGDSGRGPGAVGEVLGCENTGCWARGDAGGHRWRGERVPQDEEAEPGEAGIAGEGGGCATWSEEEKVVVVVADEQENRHGKNDGLEEGSRDEMHAHEEEKGAGQEGVGVECHGEGILTDDHVEGRSWRAAHEEMRLLITLKGVAASRGGEGRGHFGDTDGFSGGDGLRLGGEQ